MFDIENDDDNDSVIDSDNESTTGSVFNPKVSGKENKKKNNINNNDDDDNDAIHDNDEEEEDDDDDAEEGGENDETDDDEEDDDVVVDDDIDEIIKNDEETNHSVKNKKPVVNNLHEDDDDSDSDSDPDDNYLQKFDERVKNNIISDYHPELNVHNNEEVEALSRVIRDKNGYIIDPLHKTIPFLTKYEKARILGERSKQINSGATPFVKVDISVIDGYLIALEELEQKKIPFIIKRPLPNGGCEYWKLKDLEFI